jgi:hypothetical protein
LVQNTKGLFGREGDMEELRGTKPQAALEMDFDEARSESPGSLHKAPTSSEHYHVSQKAEIVSNKSLKSFSMPELDNKGGRLFDRRSARIPRRPIAHICRSLIGISKGEEQQQAGTHLSRRSSSRTRTEWSCSHNSSNEE